MAEPWKCPECGLILAPWVSEHRCDGGGAVPASVTPPSPAGGGFLSVTTPGTWTTTNVTSGTTAAMTWVPEVVTTAIRSAA